MKIENIKIQKIKPYSENPRNNANSIDKVADSIAEFGFRQPIVVDEDMIVLAGHTRLLASKKLGLDKVPVHIAEGLSSSQKKAYRIMDNKSAEDSSWDKDLLNLEIKDLIADDYDLNMTGFSSEEIEELSVICESILEGKTDEDSIPEPPKEPKSKLGDIYQLGHHRLVCGDSTSIDAVDKLMNGDKADMVFTDPPYNADYSSEVDKKRRKPWGGIKNDNMSADDFDVFLEDINSVLWLSCSDGASIYECIDWKRYPQIQKVFNDAFTHKAMIVWNKNCFGLGTYYRTKHELILFGCKGDTINTWNANHDEMDVWDISRDSRASYNHPTQKPVAIPERAIKNSSNPKNKVLDLFGGSGSTLLACEKLARKCYMMELDPRYVDVIIERWENFTGKKAKRINES